MISTSEDRARIQNELGEILTSLETSVTENGATSLRGTMRFGASLVGPKDRLHGGLHAYARTLALLAALPEHDDARTYPARLQLGLYRPLPLETPAPFEGTYHSDATGYELVTDFADRDKLHAIATPALDAVGPLAWFRDAHARALTAAPVYTIRAQRDIPMAVHPDVVVAPLGREMRTVGSPSFARFVRDDGTVDVSAVCVIIDLLGAVTQGYAWTSRIFTTRMDLVVTAASIPGDVDLVAMSDRAAEPDAECHVRPAPTKDGMSGPMKVRVILADATFERTYAHGTITLIPAPGELPLRS